MTAGGSNRLLVVLVGLLLAVVVAQSIMLSDMVSREEHIPPARPGQSGTGSGSTSFDPDDAFGADTAAWDPFTEFRNMQRQMGQMFNDSFGRFRQIPDFESLWGDAHFSPNMDLEEKKEKYIIRMHLPGADKPDITVNINDRQLRVAGKVNEEMESQGSKSIRKEHRSGEFSRTLTLPGPVKADEMEAEYKNGVLTITVPKAAADNHSRNIEIR